MIAVEIPNPAGLLKTGGKFLANKVIGKIRKDVKEFDTVPYRPTNSPLVNHHGVNDVWAKNNIPGYKSRATDNPTIALGVDEHKAAH
ncbi:hypothetical protein SG34_030000 [Thalassomonas viridans]|uniref:Tox-SHH domain-containing protein n=1 Tax=Thalassomonas viridans TaxID=137584 RepID=A0AAE9ZGN7_9GAMM|nr:hypothetical protein SG34_030000 [Thalassomonas viridans]